MHLLEPTAQIWMNVDPYHQRHKCRPMNLVSENIRFMRIFAGVPLGGGVKRQWRLSTTAIFGDLGGYVFENFRDTGSSNMWRYGTACRPANDCKMNDLEWPSVAISWQNAFSASTSWIRAFECQKSYNPWDYVVFCALCDQLASLGRHAQLTRCFSAVAELLVSVVKGHVIRLTTLSPDLPTTRRPI